MLVPSALAVDYFVPGGQTWMPSGAPASPVKSYMYKIRNVGAGLPLGGNLIRLSNQSGSAYPVPGITRNAPFEIIFGYGDNINTNDGWVAVRSFFATASGAGSPVAANFPPNAGPTWDYLGPGRTTDGGMAVSEAGATAAIPEMQEVGQKVGVSLTNSTGQPQTYIIRPRDAAGNAIPGMPDEVVELAPGQSWGKQYARPSGPGGIPGSSAGSGAFKVGVSRMDWVPDVEFGGSKQEEVPISNNDSKAVNQPITQAPTPPTTGSTGGNTNTVTNPSAPAAAQNTQVSGGSAATASQMNSLTNNVTEELKRLGGIVKASGDAAHVDAVATLNAIKAQSSGGAGAEVDVSGIISAVNQGTNATNSVADGVAELKGALTGDGDEQGELGEGVPEDDGAFLTGLQETFDLIKARFAVLADAFGDAWQTVLPGSSARQSLDFQIPTPFGAINFNISQYDVWIALFRDVMMLVISWQMLISAFKMIRGAFADAN